jgi:elongation factor P--(R)-beta-lysine ligase
MSWHPSASIETLTYRASVYAAIRHYFQNSDCLEVETPIWSSAAVTDPWLDSFRSESGFLHTSPEYFMKRLLAAGSADIYQICKVFRRSEQGSRHNPEFSMLEWYRVGFSYEQLMQEIVELIKMLASKQIEVISKTYEQWFLDIVGLNPFTQKSEIVKKAVEVAGFEFEDSETALDILVSHVIEKEMPKDALCLMTHYPEDQAALAEKMELNGHKVAQRFELYWHGFELANGYYELTDAVEQKKRMLADIQKRKEVNKEPVPLDQNFIDALTAGLPKCAGVALGLDRLIMALSQEKDITKTMSFDVSRS